MSIVQGADSENAWLRSGRVSLGKGQKLPVRYHFELDTESEMIKETGEYQMSLQ